MPYSITEARPAKTHPPCEKRVWEKNRARVKFAYEIDPAALELPKENPPTPTKTASGVCDYGFRFYHPELGRWLSRDPIAEDGGLNLYGFIGNDPVNDVDILGLQSYRRGRSHAFGETLEGAFEVFYRPDDPAENQAHTLLRNFFTGLGSSFEFYYDNDPLTQELKDHIGITKSRENLKKILGELCQRKMATENSSKVSISGFDFKDRYNLYEPGARAAGALDILDFVTRRSIIGLLLGSYAIEGYTSTIYCDCNEGRTEMTWNVWNDVSNASFNRDPLTGNALKPSYREGPYRTIRTEFIWDETITFTY